MSVWKETSIGKIPADWSVQQASHYCPAIVDGTHESPKSQSSGYPLITSKHIKGSSIDFANAYLISETEYFEIIRRSRVEQYDLIISMIGEYCGFTYLETSTETNYAVKNVGLFKNKDLVNARWLMYYLRSPIGTHQLRLNRGGTSQPYISLQALRNLLIVVPSSENEKREITETLSCLDCKIENLRKQNETLEAIAQTLFKHWFVDFEFPNEDGKPYKSSGGEMQRSETGEFPAHWKIGKLGDITKVINGRAYKQTEFREKGTPIVRIQNLTGKGQTVYSDLVLDEDKYISKGDLIYAWSATFGPYIWRGVKSIYHYHIWKLNCFNQSFKYYLYIHLKRVSDRVKNQGTGSIFTHITKELMESQELFIPVDQVMFRWHSVASPIFDKIMLNHEQIETLTKTRDVLLPQLISGKLRIAE